MKLSDINTENLMVISNEIRDLYVVKRSWFEDLPVCQQRSDTGYQADCPNKGEEEGCQCARQPTYQYWDGHNNRTAALETAELPGEWSEMDEDVQEKIIEALRATHNEEPVREMAGVQFYKGKEYIFKDSQYQDVWELYQVGKSWDDFGIYE